MADPLTDLVAATLGLSAEQVDDSTIRTDIDAWTSLKHLQIAAAVESTFGVALTPREIRRINSVGHLRELLREREGSA